MPRKELKMKLWSDGAARARSYRSWGRLRRFPQGAENRVKSCEQPSGGR